MSRPLKHTTMKRSANPISGENKIYSSPEINIIDLVPETVICQASSVAFGNSGWAGTDILEDNITEGGDF